MRSDLNRAVGRVLDRDVLRRAAFEGFDVTGCEQDLARNHLLRQSSFDRSCKRTYRFLCSLACEAVLRFWHSVSSRREGTQRMGLCTVTSLVPSGNVPSTMISWIISGTP